MSTLQTTNIKHPDSGSNQVTFSSSGDTTVSGSTSFSSPIKASKLENASTTAGGLEIDSSGHVTVDSVQMPTAGALSNRNMIINGGMAVSQRAISNTGQTATSYRACDRFKVLISTLGTWTISQSTDAPSGFGHSLEVACTTPKTSLSNTNYIQIRHVIEAQNLQSLRSETGTEAFTVSFWVKSNKTGAASLAIMQTDNASKLATLQYTISSAGTWEYKTITFPADLAGVINSDNGAGLTLEWWLNSGATYTGGSLQSTWATNVSGNRNPSNLGLGGTVNDYYQITGVQLEAGSKSTPFENESYGQTLAKCQRYYQSIAYATDSSFVYTMQIVNSSRAANGFWPVELRAAPTVTATVNSGSIATTAHTSKTFYIQVSAASTSGTSIYVNSLAADAEL